MNDRDILTGYLSEQQPFATPQGEKISTLISGFRDARRVTTRPIVSGLFTMDELFDPERNWDLLGCWLGAMGYMTVMDQIGTAFQLVDQIDEAFDSPVYRALKNFGGGLDDRQIHALIALRNAFMHDYNLVNVPKTKNKTIKKLQTHRFSVTAFPSDDVVRLPEVEWTGDYENKQWDPRTATEINLFGLGNIVERLLLSLRMLLDQGNLAHTEVNIQAFYNKYCFLINPQVKKISETEYRAMMGEIL
jgi:hypothetical protein